MGCEAARRSRGPGSQGRWDPRPTTSGKPGCLRADRSALRPRCVHGWPQAPRPGCLSPPCIGRGGVLNTASNVINRVTPGRWPRTCSLAVSGRGNARVCCPPRKVRTAGAGRSAGGEPRRASLQFGASGRELLGHGLAGQPLPLPGRIVCILHRQLGQCRRLAGNKVAVQSL